MTIMPITIANVMIIFELSFVIHSFILFAFCRVFQYADTIFYSVFSLSISSHLLWSSKASGRFAAGALRVDVQRTVLPA